MSRESSKQQEGDFRSGKFREPSDNISLGGASFANKSNQSPIPQFNLKQLRKDSYAVSNDFAMSHKNEL